MLLNRRVAIIVPSTINGNEPAPAELVARRVQAAKVRLATLFGGFTAIPGKGGWVSATHGLVEEDVTVVQAFTDDEGLAKGIEAVREFALNLALVMNQEAVSIQIDNSLEFVSAVPALQLKAV